LLGATTKEERHIHHGLARLGGCGSFGQVKKGKGLMFQKIFISALFASLYSGVSIAEETWSCPDAEAGQSLFNSGEMKSLPNYAESAGARVQRQYPDTAFTGAQAKFIDWDERTLAICLYYSHIGVVASSAVLNSQRDDAVAICDKAPCPTGPYWRYEFTESDSKQDKPGREQMLVCMEDRDGLAYPSAGCGFTQPE